MNHNSQYNRPTYWLLSHCRALLFGLGEMMRSPLASIMTLVVIGIAMAFPAGLYVFLKNIQGISHQWNGNPTISLYLKQNVPVGQINMLENSLKNNPKIAKVEYISPQQGLQQFAQKTQLNGLITSLQNNPLPGVIVITPIKKLQSPGMMEALLSQLKQIPLVSVGQLDMQWVKRLYYIITLGKRVTYGLALLFSLGVILIVGNTIRMAMQQHQQEINVLRLIGATRRFIRRPLLYRGFLFGLFGGLLAWGLVSAMMLWIAAPAQQLISSYSGQSALHGLSIRTGMNIVIACCLLGLIGAWITVQRHLSTHETS